MRKWIRLLSCRIDFERVRFDFFLKASLASQPIDGFVLRGLNDPCGGRIRNSFVWPLNRRRSEGFLRGLFSKVEIAKRSD